VLLNSEPTQNNGRLEITHRQEHHDLTSPSSKPMRVLELCGSIVMPLGDASIPISMEMITPIRHLISLHLGPSFARSTHKYQAGEKRFC
jgi:hypothetical protein